MERREFSAALAVGMLGLSGVARAQGKPQNGEQYLTLDQPVAVEVPAGKIEVIEFFWYSCPHCNAFEPTLEPWIKRQAKDVVVRRVPVAFRPDFGPQQRLFFALEAMGRVDDIHSKVFHAIHVEKQPLNTDAAIIAWAEKQGLDKAKFTAQFTSFGASTKASKAVQLQNAFKVQGVPSLGIAGRYYTDGTLAGGTMAQALAVTDYLVAEARKAK